MHHLRPISMDENNPTQPRPLSPLNLLTDNKSIYVDASRNRNKQLKQILHDLKCQLRAKKEKNASMKASIQHQAQQIDYWRNCSILMKQNYMEKEKIYNNMINPTTHTHTNNNKQSHRIKTLEKKAWERMASDNNEEQASKDTTIESIGLYHKKSVKKISSVLAEQKKLKKRQALSLTHLHRYHQE